MYFSCYRLVVGSMLAHDRTHESVSEPAVGQETRLQRPMSFAVVLAEVEGEVVAGERCCVEGQTRLDGWML